MTQQLQADVYDSDVVEIISSLQEWHAIRIQKLEMIVDAMDDVGLQLRLPDGSYSELVGDERKGFQAGVKTALDLFRKFPLAVFPLSEEL
ncbi:hypothetical protein [Pseudomonas sp. HMWF006]|uniref:hypothetical protein n=1 Tax=Pseudomonas sp. HMWF006 TaxID=2056843 RepID=UPI000D47AF5F|nr:hypothetical protein [Pseudomonas sp. HMWF006]PTT02739.1 hypothetical protein DBR24_06335 [Pseudomonas sp. HMWF006]PTT94739.1 hypothetical protein DBR29_02505 [Pseudomonas sp. HMWF005]